MWAEQTNELHENLVIVVNVNTQELRNKHADLIKLKKKFFLHIGLD